MCHSWLWWYTKGVPQLVRQHFWSNMYNLLWTEVRWETSLSYLPEPAKADHQRFFPINWVFRCDYRQACLLCSVDLWFLLALRDFITIAHQTTTPLEKPSKPLHAPVTPLNWPTSMGMVNISWLSHPWFPFVTYVRWLQPMLLQVYFKV